jgi:pyruvate-formate lyase-activating enzyme
MKVKRIIDEDFTNYAYQVSMLIAMPSCTFKCEKECGARCCQNSALARAPDVEVDVEKLVLRYLRNRITRAVCFGGLEPFDSFEDVYAFADILRNKYRCGDILVIYTGYYRTEITQRIEQLKPLGNIIVKFGRFLPNREKHYDPVLGVELASDNQYAERIC